MEEKPIDYYRALYQIVSEISSSAAPEGVLKSIVRSTAMALGAKGCSLMLLATDGKQLIHAVSYGLSSFYIRKGPVKITPILDEALKGKSVAVDDVNADTRVQYRAQAIMEGIASILSIPIMLKGEVIGVLRIYTTEPRRFSPADMEFLNCIASFGAIALTKAREYEAKEQYYQERLKEKVAQWAELKNDLVEMELAKAKLLTFLSMAAHDLKAPLSAIQTYFDVMLGGFVGELNEKQREIIERSSERVNGLYELIRDLLNICRIETAPVVGEVEELSMIQLAKGPIEDAQRLAQEKGVKLVIDIPSELPLISGSIPRLQEVLTNLLSNAIKFTLEGGSVIFRLAERNGAIVGEVQDTGIGIPTQDFSHLFEDFFRARNARATPGTGLGLSITKRIIEAHGGQIRVESPCVDTGVGSKFTFTLPAGAH
jgi:two-component system, sensor histidine kinase and response regulator